MKLFIERAPAMKPLAIGHVVVWLALALGGAFLSGCKATEDEELSTRPWNTPKSWEHGLPTGMYEGR